MNQFPWSPVIIGSCVATAVEFGVFLAMAGVGIFLAPLLPWEISTFALLGGAGAVVILFLAYYSGGYVTGALLPPQWRQHVSYVAVGVWSLLVSFMFLFLSAISLSGVAKILPLIGSATLMGTGAGVAADPLMDVISGRTRIVNDLKVIDGKVISYFERNPVKERTNAPAAVKDTAAQMVEAVEQLAKVPAIKKATDKADTVLASLFLFIALAVGVTGVGTLMGAKKGLTRSKLQLASRLERKAS